MSTATASPPVKASNLDNLTLSRKEGWRDFTEAHKRVCPEALKKSQIRCLGDTAADSYNQRRTDWHDNLGPFKTPQLAALHDDLWDIIDSNAQDGNHAKGAVALSGYPGLGKTTAVEAFAKDFHRREIRRHGEFTRAGDERWPVCRIGMTGNTSMKDFNRAMCHFYAHPGRSGSTDELGRRALDYVLHCETRLLIIDFLHWQHRGGIEINNHFKYIANDFPVTLLSIGVGLKERGLLIEDYSYDELLAQTARRTTLLEMRPYEIDTERQRRDWRNLLTTIEQRLVLGDKHRGMLAEELSDYLFIRSTGHIGSLMDLLRRGCARPSDSHGNRVSNPEVTRYHQDRQRCRAGAPRTGRRIPHPEENHQAATAMIRTLPLRVTPDPGEALDSWLEAVAIRYDLSLGEITRAVGIPHSVRPRWMTKLAHRELQSLSLTTGLSSECFESMTLNHFHQAALEVDHLSGHLVSTFPWGVTYRSRYCPHCLRESGGRWQLAWRLKWSFLCTVHRCLLVDQCPQCRNNQRTRAAFLMATPRLGRCTATQKSPDCDGDLRDAQTLQLPAAHPAVVAQHRVYDVIAQRCASFGVYAEDSAAARDFLSDLRALASRVLAHAKCSGVTDTSDEELIATYLDQQPPHAAAWSGRKYTSSKEPPKTAAETAVSIAAALKILGAETIADAAAAMKWLVEPCGAGQKPAGFSAGLHASPIVVAIYIKAFSTELGPALQLRHRSNLAIPGAKRTDPAIAEVLARRIPPMLWPAWAVRVQPRGAHKSVVPQCLSCATVLAATRITVTRAAKLLGGNLDIWTLTGNLNVLRRDPRWAAISIALTRLADYLSAHAPPIDYERRRHLDYSRLLATADWRRICAAAGVPPGGPSTAQVARIALFARISGLPPEKFLTACKPEVRHGLLYRVRDLPLHLTPPLLEGLDKAGRLLLDLHHIDEPLTWHPPLRFLDGLDLPNTDVHRVDIDVLHSLAAKPRATARSIAAALGTDPDVVRHLLAEQPVDAHQTNAENPASMKSGLARARLRRDLTADQLRVMHHVEGKSGFAIAREIGVSYVVLRTLATSYGITFGHRPRRPTPEWLREQYVLKRRTLVDIANELNVCALTVSGWVRRDRLSSIPPAASEAAEPLSTTDAADLLAPVLARRAGRRQLENFLQALNHPNVAAAAASCGIDRSTLWHQIRQLEKDLGGPLLLRAHMPLLSMAPTALGSKVAAAAKAVHNEAQGQRP